MFLFSSILKNIYKNIIFSKVHKHIAGFCLTQIVSDELVKLMGGEVSELTFAKSGPTVILLAGLQGVGKTTVSAKLALYLKKQVHFNLNFNPLYLYFQHLKTCVQFLTLFGLCNCNVNKNYRGRVAC